MSTLAIGGIILLSICCGALLGILLRARLPETHMCPESKDTVKLGMGLIGTMTALVLGLLVASAKSSYDAQRNGVAQLAANVIIVDRTLAHYGPETKETRDELQAVVTDMLERTWPEEHDQSKSKRTATEGRYEYLYEKIQELKPKNDAQRNFQAQAVKYATDTMQMRWQLFAQRDNSIPTTLLVIMVSWLTLIFGSFGLFAPRNATAIATLVLAAVVVSSALFLVLELDRPFDGVIKVPSTPLRNALTVMGK
jgi:hypothetical protein